MRRSVSLRRVGAAAAGATGLILVTALPAVAHVTVSSPDAAPGGFGKLVFRVPNESDTANTTKFVVKLPTDTPFASVSTKPMPGWTVEAEPTKLDEPVELHGATLTEAVTEITWTAQKGGGLPPDQFTEFEVSLGTFPENADQLMFPAIQTYSDGEVARWVQPVEAGAPEPENPAPVLQLTSTGDAPAHDEATTEAEGAGNVEEASATQPVAADSDDMTARILSGVAVAIAAVALLAALRPRVRKSS